MKYWIDTEFIENGTTIDLLSIGIVAEDGREYYRQHIEAKFKLASDWVWRNVFPHLKHFSMSGDRSCNPASAEMMSKHDWCHDTECPWRSRYKMRDEIKQFCDIEKYGKPEFWGYYADYDWVAFCQLFGTMMELPNNYPMFCNDIKQLAGDIDLNVIEQKSDHSAIADARWNRAAYHYVMCQK